jgi:hypothetical protein
MNSWRVWASEQKAPKYAKSGVDCSLAATLSCVNAIFESAQSGSSPSLLRGCVPRGNAALQVTGLGRSRC